MITALALRAIRARPLRSALTTVAVALAIAVVLAVSLTLSELAAASQAAARSAAGTSGLDVRVTAGTGLSAAQVADLGALPGVVDAEPLYDKRVIARVATSDVSGVTANVVALGGGDTVALRPISLVAGRFPTTASTREVVVDSGFAAVLAAHEHLPHLGTGDSLQLTTETGPDTFTIVGLGGPGGSAPSFTRSAVYVTDRSMLSQFALGLRTSMVALQLGPGVSYGTVAREVHAGLRASVATVDPLADAGSPLQEVQPLLLLLTVLSVVVGAGAAATSVALSIAERQREIGLLRAAGASVATVFRLFLAEVLLLAVLALPFGWLAGIGLAAALQGHFVPNDLGSVGIATTPLQVALAGVAGLSAALAGGAAVARGTGRSIIANLQPQPGGDRERLAAMPLSLAPLLLAGGAACLVAGGGAVVATGAILVLAGVLCALPLLAPLTARLVGAAARLLTPRAPAATRNLVRRRNRTALTLAGLVIAVASAVAASALSTGAVAGGDDWISHLFAGDVVVRSPVTETQQVEASLAAATGVRQALPLRFLTTASGTTVFGVTAIDAAAASSTEALRMVTPGRADAFRQIGDSASFLAPESLAAANGWAVGRSVTLRTLDGTAAFLVAGIVEHSYPAGNGAETLVIDRSQALRWFGPAAAGFDDLDVSTAGNSAALTSLASSYGLSVVTVDDIRASAQRALAHDIGLLLAVAIIALVVAMIAVVNTLAVNVRQGRREVGLMRAVGLDRSSALRLVLTESAILAASGAIIGVGAGCVLVVGMLHAVSTPSFAPPFTFPYVTALAIAAAVVGGSVIATVVPALRASRDSIVAAIHRD
ncbi:MAG: FtsX-like permease family protein [Candidatus Dormibacteria bacterium]